MAQQYAHQLYEQALDELKDRLVSELGDQIDMLIVYGSVARGDSTSDSDIDVMIVSTAKQKIEDKARAIRVENDLRYETLTTLIFYTPQEFEYRIEIGVPLLKNVLREGRVLYGQERFGNYQKASAISH